MSINTVDRLILFNDILSRCDTIHDFTGERAKKVMHSYDGGFDTNSVYSYLHQTPPLNIDNIRNRFINLQMDKRTLEDLNLILRRKENPNFNFLQSYRNGVDERSCGYEPSVVQFFEHALGQYDMLDAFYLLSSVYIKETCLIDYTADDATKTMDEILGKICIMELGNVKKTLSADDDGDGDDMKERPPTGIWQNDAKLAAFRANLKEFFTDFKKREIEPNVLETPRKIRFVIDASIVSNDIFHEDSNDGIKVALLACSEWDSATKYSKGIPVPSGFWTTNSVDSADRVLYQLKSMIVQSGKPDDNLVVQFDGEPVFSLDKIPREVGNIVEILIQENKQKNKTSYSPSQAVRAINKTLPTKLNQKDQEAIQGTFFDIKRTGDGCQVIQIKQENAKEDAKFKYVLVTNDHLAFLKARMNRVPVVFTKRNTITGNKRLFLINDVEKGEPKDLAEHLLSSLENENNALQNFLSKTAQIETIKGVFDRVIDQFQILKVKMEEVYFGRDRRDEYFTGLLLRAIMKREPALSPQQRQDLEFISMRMKAYLYDFFAIHIDLKMRRAMIKRVFAQYEYLFEITNETLIRCDSLYINQKYEDIIKLCRNALAKHAAVKTRGYGHVLYGWTLETDIEGILQSKFHDINGQLEKSPATAIALLTNKHFLLQDSDSTQIQTILNFKPLKVYSDIWRFLSASFKSLSMTNQAPRASRRSIITTKSDGSSAFLMKAKEFIGKAQKFDPQKTQMPTDLNELIDEVCGMDEFYKLLIMEENAQNFSLKMVDAGFVDDWLSTNKFSGGGGTYPMSQINPIDPMNSVSDSNSESDENYAQNTHETPINFAGTEDDGQYDTFSNSNTRMNHVSNKRDRNTHNARLNGAKRMHMNIQDKSEYYNEENDSVEEDSMDFPQDDIEELRKILYFEFLEFYDGMPRNCIYHSHANYIKLERTLESYIQNINDFKGMAANDALNMILNTNQQFSGGEYLLDSEIVDMVTDIIKQCRSVAFEKHEWKSVIRALLHIRQPEKLPRYVTDHEWVRFLTNKLMALPKQELKALHMKRCAPV
jgi:hypothetical protein